MCEQCVKEGKQSKEEYAAEVAEGKFLLNTILDMLEGKKDATAINVLISSLINVVDNCQISPESVIKALSLGLGIPVLQVNQDTLESKGMMN